MPILHAPIAKQIIEEPPVVCPVTQRSNALDLQPKVFKSTNPHRIALSLKRSAETSKRRKGTAYQSAMSMLNFYINRAGKSLPEGQKRVLERAKDELRDVFGRA